MNTNQFSFLGRAASGKAGERRDHIPICVRSGWFSALAGLAFQHWGLP